MKFSNEINTPEGVKALKLYESIQAILADSKQPFSKTDEQIKNISILICEKIIETLDDYNSPKTILWMQVQSIFLLQKNIV